MCRRDAHEVCVRRAIGSGPPSTRVCHLRDVVPRRGPGACYIVSHAESGCAWERIASVACAVSGA